MLRRSGGDSSRAASALVQRALLRAGSVEAVLAVVSEHRDILDGTHVRTALHRLTRLDSGPSGRQRQQPGEAPGFAALAQAVSRHAVDWEGKDLALAATALASLRASGAACPWPAIGDALATRMRQGCASERDVGTGIWAMATARCSHAAAFEAASEACVVDSLAGRSVVNVAWAFATMRHVPERAVDFTGRLSERVRHLGLPTIADQGISSLAWSMAVVGGDQGALMVGELLREAAGRPDLAPRVLASVLWAGAKVQCRDATSYDILESRVSRRLTDSSAQDLSAVVWALASTRCGSSQFFGAAATEALPRVATFNGQQVSNLMWSFAVVRFEHPGLSEEFVRHTRTRIGLPSLSDQALSNVVWSMATLERELDVPRTGSSDDLLSEVAREASCRAEASQVSAQISSNLVWAYASLVHREARNIVKSLGSAAAPRVAQEFNTQNMANFVWAAATVRWRDPQLLEAVSRAAAPRVNEFAEMELANLAWSFAALHAAGTLPGNAGCEGVAPKLLAAVAAELCARGGEVLSPLSTAQLLWAYAVCGVYPRGLFWMLFGVSGKCLHPSQPNRDRTCSQLWLAVLGFLLDAHGAAALLPSTDDLFEAFPHLREVQREAQAQKERALASSRVHAEVSSHLAGLGRVHTCEYQTAEGLFLDVALTALQVAIEVDGRDHFVDGPGVAATTELDGPTLFKHRILARLGWQVISIPEQDWKQLASARHQRGYLIERLRAAGLDSGDADGVLPLPPARGRRGGIR